MVLIKHLLRTVECLFIYNGQPTSLNSLQVSVVIPKCQFLIKYVLELPACVDEGIKNPDEAIDFLFGSTPIGELDWRQCGQMVTLYGGERPYTTDIGALVALGAHLIEIKGCPGFETLIANFRNTRQYQATVFEVIAGHFVHCLNGRKGVVLEKTVLS